MRLHSDPGQPKLERSVAGPAPRAYFHPFHQPTRTPGCAVPALSCDAQIHVFGPASRYPVRPGAVYEAPEAALPLALGMHRTLGLQRTVLVQPTTYGTDHSALLDALGEAGAQCRGCAVIDDSVSDDALRRLHEAGVRSARFNFFSALNAVPDAASFRRSIARISELGWSAKLNLDAGGLVEHAALLRPLKTRLVIDHFGRPDFSRGANDQVVRDVVAALRRGNVWVMLSNGHKLSKSGYPWNDAVPVARAYLDAAPDRVIWGSDWPHPLSTSPVPDDADLLELLFRMAPDAADRQRILVDTPAALFEFASEGGWPAG